MALALFGLVLVCYWPALSGALLWDDPAHVPRPELRSWSGLGRIWTDAHATQQYYPVLFSAFWVEHRLWGDATLGYHLVNVLLHAASSLLLALMLRRLWSPPDDPAGAGASGGRVVPAGAEWMAALLFAVHPICVESVAWITEQKNTLSTFFYLLAALTYLDFAANRRWRAYALASGLFLLALGSKTATVTLPAALLVLLWWRHGRLSWRRDVAPLAPWFLAAAAMGLFTSWVERKVIGAEGADFELSGFERVMLASRTIWFYLGKFTWPIDLNFFYPRWDVSAAAAGWAGYLAATLGVTFVLWWWRHRSRGPLAVWLIFIGTLFPILGFFKVYFFIFSYVNDHFLYLASLGLIAAVTGGTALLLAGAPAWVRTSALVLFGLLLAGLTWLSHQQSRLYRDNETLFSATIAKNPDSWMGHHILGFALAKSPDRHAEAIIQFREALRLNPEYPDAHLALAVELAREQEHKAEAIAHYEKALELRPNYVEAHNNLAVELARQPEHTAEALTHLETALRLKPEFTEAHRNLADLLARLPDRKPEVIAHYEEALRFRPDSAEGHAGLANLLATLPARLPEALAHYEQSLRINPDSAGVHFNFANALARLTDRRSDALSHYETAVALKPDYAAAHANMGNVLATLPDRKAEAIMHYETALRLNPALAGVHHNLANQLAQIPGREAEAISHGEAGLQLEPGNVDACNTLAILYARQGQLGKAEALWEKALQLNPNFEPARQNLRLLEQMSKH